MPTRSSGAPRPTGSRANAGMPSPLFLQVGFPGPHPPYDPPAAWSRPYLERALPLCRIAAADLAAQPPPWRGAAPEARRRPPRRDAAHRRRAARRAAPPARALPRPTSRSSTAKWVGCSRTRGGRPPRPRRSSCSRPTTATASATHGHSQKWTMYEEVVRVPMIVWSPRALRGPRARSRDSSRRSTSRPHCSSWPAASVPEWWETRSVLPALRGEAFEGRAAVYCEQGRDVVFQFSDFVSMLRTDRWKFVHFLGESFGQLFDLRDDPVRRARPLVRSRLAVDPRSAARPVDAMATRQRLSRARLGGRLSLRPVVPWRQSSC